VGSAPEVVLDGITGLVTGFAPEELARATLELLERPERRAEMGAAARARAATEFGAQRLVDDISRLYEEIVNDLEL
jgi:glycosyltransferase involved in cell wall biosynthesis